MQQSLNEINKQRDLLNYEYSHLYNMARKGLRYVLPSLTNSAQAMVYREGTAEYGVFVTKDDKRKCWRFDTFERCVAWAQENDGTVVRLGRNSNFHVSWDVIDLSLPRSTALLLAVVDQSGAVEVQDIKIDGDPKINTLISTELTNLGWPRAIQCNRTPPPANVLFDLHQRHAEISFEDFAVAVLKHCEVAVGIKKSGRKHLSAFRSDEEKDAWRSTPAGQEWLKEHPIPPIMNHTKKELPGWKNREQSI